MGFSVESKAWEVAKTTKQSAEVEIAKVTGEVK